MEPKNLFDIGGTTVISATTTPPGGTNLFAIIGIIVVIIISALVVFLIIRRIFFPKWTPRFLRKWLTGVSARLLERAGVAPPVIHEFQSTMRQSDYPCPDQPGRVQSTRQTDGSYDYPMMSPPNKEDLWEIEPLSLQISSNKLGAGAYAVVFSGNLRGAPPVTKVFPTMQLSYVLSREQNEVAVKLTHPNAKKEEISEFLQEIVFMKELEYHPHLLSMLGCSSDPRYPVLITEYCERGDLLHLLRRIEDDNFKDTERLTINELLPIVWQVSDGLVYLTERKIIHRDVAARNVLITKENMAKLSDFGLCRYSNEMFYTTRGGKLPIKWMAPESLEFAIFSSKTDVWSFGVLLWEVYSLGKTPYCSVQSDEVLPYLRAGNRLGVPEKIPEWMTTMMQSCWESKPDDRPDISTIQKSFYAIMESDSNYGYLQFSKNYYTTSPQRAPPNEYVIS
ncbi:unnamed protein product, partial [Mesorhabditis spiculigera]